VELGVDWVLTRLVLVVACQAVLLCPGGDSSDISLAPLVEVSQSLC
jgi:hypothetical protein